MKNTYERITDFRAGTIILAIINEEITNKRENGVRISDIVKGFYGNPSKTDTSRVIKIIQSIKDNGISIKNAKNEKKVFKIISGDSYLKTYKVNYNELFRLFIETLIEYPPADEGIEGGRGLKLIESIKKTGKSQFIKAIQAFAQKFNFEKQEFALSELGSEVAYSCAMFPEECKGMWRELGKFTKKKCETRRGMSKELQ